MYYKCYRGGIIGGIAELFSCFDVLIIGKSLEQGVRLLGFYTIHTMGLT